MKMETGTLVRTKHNIRNSIDKKDFDYKHMFYKLCDGAFAVYDEKNDRNMQFVGRHFVCQGSDYFHRTVGNIAGFEILREGYYDVINELPTNLIK